MPRAVDSFPYPNSMILTGEWKKISTHPPTPKGARQHELFWLSLLFKADPCKMKDRYHKNARSASCLGRREVTQGIPPLPPPASGFSPPSPHPYRLRLNGTFQKPICFRHLLISFLICHIRTQYINPNQQIASDREPS